MNATVTTTSVSQTGNEILGTKEKKLYYLLIQTPKGKITINVGQKTHDQIQELTSVLTPQTEQNDLDKQNDTGGRGNRRGNN